ncbi:hypothetical protein JOC77_001758 [Peribacillus deserti]|uniref:Uncharacterized protein n=1 Tax=Peribacillus deserti TaxID=673318 RepID=A0ABS2QGP0_9BACI|nr:hypothetical protein [Peribacillus deserti]
MYVIILMVVEGPLLPFYFLHDNGLAVSLQDNIGVKIIGHKHDWLR